MSEMENHVALSAEQSRENRSSTAFEECSASIDSLSVSIDRLLAQKSAMDAALREIEEIADDRADVDDGIPDDWMRVLVIARAALAKVQP